ncbi:MAG: glucose-1-phosphate adenylyltransferase [Chloroflexi bacterium]|nr:glucose-1-phosphate adenylyltransferase [Chloroflexota bacterium]
MKVRSIILAGGEGTRLGVLTAKRTKPAVPFGGKYRIIDFPLSNCVNSNIFDIMIVAQYRPHSLIEHIGAGGPWDLNRDFTGGVRIFSPYRSHAASWFVGTADAVQQNFTFIKRGNPDLVLILSGDHVYTMDYSAMIAFHIRSGAEVTMGVIPVPFEEAPRFGIVGIDEKNRVTSFVEKPAEPPSNLANMGIYLFNLNTLNEALWEDHINQDSSHDFGKDIMPRLIDRGVNIYAFPYQGYWVDVGTVNSYWQAHMDLLANPPALDLYNRSWVIHTRTEERPPAKVLRGAEVEDSLISDGCVIEPGAKVIRSVLAPGVYISAGSVVSESILLTDAVTGRYSRIERAILDKRVCVGEHAQIGETRTGELSIPMIGKNAVLPPKIVIEPGAMIGVDVAASDFSSNIIRAGMYIQTRRLPNEVY